MDVIEHVAATKFSDLKKNHFIVSFSIAKYNNTDISSSILHFIINAYLFISNINRPIKILPLQECFSKW